MPAGGPHDGGRSVLDRKRWSATAEFSGARVIIVTEAGMLHRLQKELPNKVFIPGPTDSCHLQRMQLYEEEHAEKAVAALETLSPEIIPRRHLPQREIPLKWDKRAFANIFVENDFGRKISRCGDGLSSVFFF